MSEDAASGVLDLSSTEPLLTYELNFKIPGTQKNSGWKILLAGPAHEKTIAVTAEYAREVIEKEKAIEFAQVNQRKWKTDDEDEKDRARSNVGRICRRIVSWSPNPKFSFFSAEPIEFSQATATELFLRPEMARYFLQLTEYLNGEAAFMRPSGVT